MQKPKSYTDIDYDSFPVPALDLDMHWTLLPVAVWDQQQKARQAKLTEERIAAQPPDHQVILVPADPNYSPAEEDLWPIITHAVLAALKKHPEIHGNIMSTVNQVLEDYRGYRNPYPANLEYPDRPVKKLPRRETSSQ